jgi:ribosomal-protein-alanine N-acetyltransferase
MAGMHMNSQAILNGKRVRLRKPRESDKTDRHAIGRDAEFFKMVGGDPRTITELTQAEIEEWYNRNHDRPYSWVIDYEDRCVGVARLDSLDDLNRRARYAIGIFDRTLWGRGIGTEATKLVLRYAFEELGLHRIDLKVLSFNHRAIACYEKCGFTREGIEREGALIGGEWCSDVIMSILEYEYRLLDKTGAG